MGIIWRSLDLKRKLLFGEFVRKKSTWSPVIFVRKWHVTHLWCIKNQNRKFYGFVLSQDTFSILKTIFWFFFFNFWHLWPLRGNKVFKKNKYVSYSSIIYIYGYKWVFECSFLIETLKMCIIYTLHFSTQKGSRWKHLFKRP